MAVEQRPETPDEVANKIKGFRWSNSIFPTPWFQDHAELSRARYDLFTYCGVAIAQEIRRHPKLQAKIEQVAAKVGKRIDLSQR